MKSKIYIIMFSCFMLKLGNVGLEYKYKNIVYESQKEERRFTLKL
ncbi:hypothetical protein [Mycoplasmopsis bovis]|nr:hypothetical protein [Mycoplasmopsis bovis]